MTLSARVTPPPTPTEQSLRTVTAAWVFGSVYFTVIAGAPLTLFASAMGATPFVFGLLAASPFAASLLSLPAAVWADHTGRRKGIFVTSLLMQRLLWVPVAVVPPGLLYLGWIDVPVALGLFVALFAVQHCLGAVGGPAWTSWMADLVPRRVRGRYFARRRQWGILTALPAAVVVGLLLDLFVRGRVDDPQHVLWWCAGIFLAAAAFGVVDILLFLRLPHRNPVDPADRDAASGLAQIRDLLTSLTVPLRDTRFMLFSVFTAVLTFATAPMGQFVTLLLVDRAQISNLAIQTMLLVTPMVGQLLTFGIWGRATDRYGKKAVLTAATFGIAPVALGWAVIAAHSPGDVPMGMVWILFGYTVSLLGSLAWTGAEVANFNFILEVAGTSKNASKTLQKSGGAGSGYVAVNGVVVNVAGMLGGLTFGHLAGRFQDFEYDAAGLGVVDVFVLLFVASAALRFVSVLLLPMIREDPAFRHHKSREAIRFVGANLYNNFQQALLLPTRYLRVRPRETFKA